MILVGENKNKSKWLIPASIYHKSTNQHTLEVDRVHLILTVKELSEKNSKQGLFLKYSGDKTTWGVPAAGIHLGKFAPHYVSNKKESVVFEAKNVTELFLASCVTEFFGHLQSLFGHLQSLT